MGQMCQIYASLSITSTPDMRLLASIFSQTWMPITWTWNITCLFGLQGMVEKWLLQVEKQMVKSLRDIIEKAVADYYSSELAKWVLAWPGQERSTNICDATMRASTNQPTNQTLFIYKARLFQCNEIRQLFYRTTLRNKAMNLMKWTITIILQKYTLKNFFYKHFCLLELFSI